MTGSILVTGGAGYIGSHVAKSLAKAGFTPVVYDNLTTGNRWAVKWGPFENGDILDRARLVDVVRTHKPVGVMHFAALSIVGQSVADPVNHYRVNVSGMLNVLHAARIARAAATILSSTCAVYGAPRDVPVTETAPLEPINPYGASKRMMERIMEDAAHAYGMRYAALRYFNAAGADPEGELGELRPHETHLIPLVLEAALGRHPGVSVFGEDYDTPDGTAVRDYIHVSDLADIHVSALIRLLGGGESAVVNLGTGKGVSVREVIAMAHEVTGRSVPHTVGPRRPGDAPVLVADPSRAAALYGGGLTPRSDLRTIIQTAWEFHRVR